MAKFRTNHRRKSFSLLSGTLKIIILIAVLTILLLFARPFMDLVFERDGTKISDRSQERYFLPVDDDWPRYHYKGFSLAYDESMEQARWVAYELNVDHLNAPKVPRTDFFKDDPVVKSGSATFEDYRNSGYTKGHLVPAADRAYSETTMDETFLMSNISPQTYAFNGGVWRELEEQTRDWARKNKSLYIVSGPIFSRFGLERIGANGVAVPHSFFKVILDITEPEDKGIGFIIANRKSEEPLRHYAMSIDEVEKKTGLNFFGDLLTSSLEESIEQNYDLMKWPFDERRFKQRINNWNNR